MEMDGGEDNARKTSIYPKVLLQSQRNLTSGNDRHDDFFLSAAYLNPSVDCGDVGSGNFSQGSSLLTQLFADTIKKAEITQHAKYTCTFCAKNTVKRTNVGIWQCKACKKTIAGGAYLVSYVFVDFLSEAKAARRTPAAAATRSTLRRLREIAEV
ncbi:60S ribosomal protein l37a [Sporothrix brasiliensis 5110]|uniref:60S ribosomal protein l37a n=1 Tax=Sporothrix brasiliensis 5110 TaxID=1398154 RepID=A0A0C2ITE1_9PEZI|nr:60S ribosomal protein l37a [Sporothrix brasiliensis 5110]KIH88297.1 60S ribosomal protein l37a [Sporothrix brasiliensis 5110]